MNAYGVELASFEEHWLTSIGVGETKKENKNLSRNRVEEMLQLSAIKLADDWKKPVYLIIAGSEP